MHLPAGEIRPGTKKSYRTICETKPSRIRRCSPSIASGSQHLEYLASQLLVLAGELPKAELILSLACSIYCQRLWTYRSNSLRD
ncbi:hypothetical protein, partial [Bradyrhizobium sp. RDI18]|uniref:hypothetical protein n=1 Tax=Bradyrhizobium sp. RDI18 TaxID=3367400 RepID=UPI0037137CEB